MATVQEILDALVDADDGLSKSYSSAPLSLRPAIDACSIQIEAIIKDIVRSDLHSRTGEIDRLTKELSGSTDQLKALKSSIQSFVSAGQLAQKALNALSALLPLL